MGRGDERQRRPEETRRVPKADIAGRQNVPSSMPPMGQLLSRRELRDLRRRLREEPGPDEATEDAA